MRRQALISKIVLGGPQNHVSKTQYSTKAEGHRLNRASQKKHTHGAQVEWGSLSVSANAKVHQVLEYNLTGLSG